MILIDYTHTVISSIFAQLQGTPTKRDIQPDMIRHMLLNVIRSLRLRFPKSKWGEMIICYDSPPSWRKEFFPYYKANRKKEQEKSDLDWGELNLIITELREELSDHFPFKVIGSKNAEADDIIASICHHKGVDFGDAEPIVIVSSDKDFVQLQKYGNVCQWANIKKDWVTPMGLGFRDYETYKEEHILKGDSGDGIPNILSDDACLVTGVRQTMMTKKRLLEAKSWVETDSFPNEEAKRRYIRNKMLIDLDVIPDHIQNDVIDQLKEDKIKPKGLFKYFHEKRLSLLVENIGDFV